MCLSAGLIATQGMMLFSFLAGFGCLLATTMMQPTFYVQNGHHIAVNSQGRIALAAAFYIFEGIALTPLLAMTPLYITAAAASIAGGICLGMTSYALAQPQGSLLRWGGPLA